jgi:nucleoside-diphosphate-sugar epimerase
MHVTVLGCGYVGTELACQLLDAGHEVTGVRRSEAGLSTLREAGVDAHRADVTDPSTLADLPDTDAVVFAASSGGRGADAAREVFVDGLQNAVDEYAARSNSPDRLVYTSSTGVYGDHGGDWVDETTPVEPTTEKTAVLVEAERVAREATAFDATVVRFAGLYGPDRYRLERYLEGPVVEGYLNMLHREDAAGVVRFVLETPVDDAVVLAVDDEPVSKPACAAWRADHCGVDRPAVETVAERAARRDLSTAAKRRLRTSKRCSNRRLRELGYAFAFPTFRAGYRQVIESYRE